METCRRLLSKHFLRFIVTVIESGSRLLKRLHEVAKLILPLWSIKDE